MRRSKIKLDQRAIAHLEDHPKVQAAARAVAEVGADQARRLAPVSSGFLRSHIEVWQADGGWAWGVRGVEYAVYLEWGRWKMCATPFLRPSRDAAIKAAKQFSQH